MQLALDIGTINIQNKSIDEIRIMISDFLNNQVKTISNQPMKKKGKWAKVADAMKGTMSPNTIEYLKECSQEVRRGM